MTGGPDHIGKIARLSEIAMAMEAAETPPEDDVPSDTDSAPEEEDRSAPPLWDGDGIEGYGADVARLKPEQLRPAGDPLGQSVPQRKPPDWEARCPVQALGVDNGVCYYLDPRGQVRALAAGEHGQSHLDMLFAPHMGVMDHWWPRWNKDSDWIGCKYESIRRDLMTSASRRGVWTPWGRLRGVGAWTGEDGELILHLGDQIWRGSSRDGERQAQVLKPSRLGRHVYAAGETQPHPMEAGADLCAAAHALLEIFAGWSWMRPFDARLLLGWIGAAMIGGALEWRPALWLTGDAGTGKSTLQTIIGRLFEGGIVQSADATGAGIWQVVGMSSLPVAIDELEPGETPTKTRTVIDLARQAASGAVILRGGADHNGQQFRAQSAFAFSSILRPPMSPADQSRLAILELGPLVKGRRLPDISPARLRRIGSALRGRMWEAWWRLPDFIDIFRSGLADVGHKARGADVFGTLLAVAELLLSDAELHPDVVAERCAPMAATVLAETAEQEADWQEFLRSLTTTQVQVYRSGSRRTIGKMVDQVIEAYGDHQVQAEANVNDELAAYGLRVYRPNELDGLDGWWLAIANKHTSLGTLFANTKWAGGVWAQSAGRVPGARKWKNALTFDGQSLRVTLLPIDLVRDPFKTNEPPPGLAPGGGWPAAVAAGAGHFDGGA